MVELAIVFPLLVLAALALVQFALYVHAENVTIGAAQDGARVAAEVDRGVSDGVATTQSLLQAGLGAEASSVAVQGTDDGTAVTITAREPSPDPPQRTRRCHCTPRPASAKRFRGRAEWVDLYNTSEPGAARSAGPGADRDRTCSANAPLPAFSVIGAGRVTQARMGVDAVAREAALGRPAASARDALSQGLARGQAVAQGHGLTNTTLQVAVDGPFDPGDQIVASASYTVPL
jgi:Flp pilus assembly protein TadG